VTDDPGRDAAPDARLARARLGLARPEHRPAEDGQQRGEQREPGQQHHPDADRQRDPQVGVELEGGCQQGQQRRDDGGGGERDRLADPFHGRDHRMLAVLPGAQVLPYPEDEKQAVVRARAEHQHDQQDLGQRRHLQPVMRGLGHERTGDGDREEGGDERDQRREQRAEDQQQQPDDEDDRQQLDLAVRATRLGLLVDLDRDRAGQVHVQAGWRAIAGDRAAQVLDQRGQAVAGSALADVRQHLELRGLAVGRVTEVAHLDDGRHLAQVLLQLLQPGLLRRGERPLGGGGDHGHGREGRPAQRRRQLQGVLARRAGRKEVRVVALGHAGQRRQGAWHGDGRYDPRDQHKPPESDGEGTDAPENPVNTHARRIPTPS
jgi:hypothetical protein